MQSHYRLDLVSSDFGNVSRASATRCPHSRRTRRETTSLRQDLAAVWPVFLAAVPIWLTFAFGVLVALNDMQLASRLGPSGQAAMGLCETVWYLFTLVASGIAGGVGTCVSQAVGANDKEKIRKFAVNGLAISAALGVLISMATLVLAPVLCSNLCCSPKAAAHAVSYLQLCAFGNLPYAIMQGQSAIFRSVGRPKLGLVLWLVAAIFEIAGTQFSFSAACGGTPSNLDALATYWNIGCVASVFVGFALLERLRREDQIPCPNYKSDLEIQMIKQIVVFGLPLVCGEAAIVIAHLCIYKLLGALPDGMHWQAIWAIKSRVEETIVISPLVALSLAVAAHTGFGLGAGKKVQAMKTAWYCAVASSSIVILLAGATSWLAPYIVSWSGASCELRRDGALVLSMSALLWPLLAVSIVLLGAFEGIGKTLKSTVFMGLTLLPFRLLLAAVMPLVMAPSIESVIIVVGLPQLIAAGGMLALFEKERSKDCKI